MTDCSNIENLNTKICTDLCQYYEYLITSILSITHCVNKRATTGYVDHILFSSKEKSATGEKFSKDVPTKEHGRKPGQRRSIAS